MDSKKAKALIEKYWEGKTDQIEEEELKKHFTQMGEEGTMEVEYFRFLKKKSAQNPLGDQFDRELFSQIEAQNKASEVKSIALKYWYIAASIVLIISVSIIFKNRVYQVEQPAEITQADTFEDPERAFEETKKALLFLSSKLNQSSEYTAQFSKFEQSQVHVKQN